MWIIKKMLLFGKSAASISGNRWRRWSLPEKKSSSALHWCCLKTIWILNTSKSCTPGYICCIKRAWSNLQSTLGTAGSPNWTVRLYFHIQWIMHRLGSYNVLSVMETIHNCVYSRKCFSLILISKSANIICIISPVILIDSLECAWYHVVMTGGQQNH